MDLYDVAREVTNDVMGEGTYEKLNGDSPNPGVQRAIENGSAKIEPCVLCGGPVEAWPGGGGYGANPEPLASEGRACKRCDNEKVIPARMKELGFG